MLENYEKEQQWLAIRANQFADLLSPEKAQVFKNAFSVWQRAKFDPLAKGNEINYTPDEAELMSEFQKFYKDDKLRFDQGHI